MLTIQLPPGAKALELGGGACPSIRPNADVRQCHDANGQPTVDVVCDFNQPLPFADGEYDAVFSKFVIEHLSWRSVRQFVAEVFRVMKPGGKAVFITANTEAQLEVIKKRARGEVTALPDKAGDDFGAFSCILFGDQDYEANTHRNFMSMPIAQQLFGEAGFFPVQTSPFGDLQTDMLIEATKPVEEKPAVLKEMDDLFPEKEEMPTPHVVEAPNSPEQSTHPEWYGHDYFDQGELMGGYRGGYRDFPSHVVTYEHVMTKKPTSVLELGCARGYLLKRFQDAGIEAHGMDISYHAYLTRVADNVHHWDCTKTPWPFADGQFDLCVSVNFWDHVPECLLPAVISEMKRVTKKGLHGIDFGPVHDGDRTRLVAQGREWWLNRLPKEHEVLSGMEIESGTFPKDVLEGDGKLKLNLGSHIVQAHHGWTNIDIHDLGGYAQANGYKYLKHDVKTGLPFHTGVVDAIFSSHMVEHLTYAEALTLFKECRRVIRPATGAMRIVVPNAGFLNSLFFNEMERTKGNPLEALPIGFHDLDEINVECEQSKTGMQKLHAMLYSGDHKALYDAETLIHLLSEAGWDAEESSFRGCLNHPHEGIRQIQRECLDTLQPISLFVNAVPRVG